MSWELWVILGLAACVAGLVVALARSHSKNQALAHELMELEGCLPNGSDQANWSRE